VAFQANVELLNQTVVELANSGPPNWTMLVFYLEFLEDGQIGLRNKFTGRALGGKNFEIRLDGYHIGNTVRMYDLVQTLYRVAAQHGDKWTGILLTVLSSGRFKCRFFYDQTPLLSGDDAALGRILSEGISELARERFVETSKHGAVPTVEEIYHHVKSHNLFRVIRGELGVFRTPANINADLLPTDHNELLIKALYPIAEKYNARFMERELDLALRVAARDALGVYCAIQCYYMQIVNEDEGVSNIRLSRTDLPRLLTARYFFVLNDLKNLNLSGNDMPDFAQRSALSYLTILSKQYGVQVGSNADSSHGAQIFWHSRDSRCVFIRS